jgi:hypothetical protein
MSLAAGVSWCCHVLFKHSPTITFTTLSIQRPTSSTYCRICRKRLTLRRQNSSCALARLLSFSKRLRRRRGLTCGKNPILEESALSQISCCSFRQTHIYAVFLYRYAGVRNFERFWFSAAARLIRANQPLLSRPESFELIRPAPVSHSFCEAPSMETGISKCRTQYHTLGACHSVSV